MVDYCGNNLLGRTTFPVNGDDNTLYDISNDYYYRSKPAYSDIHGNFLVNHVGYRFHIQSSGLGDGDGDVRSKRPDDSLQ
jgi:hypothetical protein